MTAYRAILCGALMVALLILLLPLRVAIGMVGAGTLFTARSAEGTVWRGTLRDVSIDGVSLGDFTARLSPLKLFTGRAAIALQSLTDRTTKASLVASFGSVGAEDVSARLLLPGAFDPLPVESIDVKEARVRFSKQGCMEADGQVRVTLTGTLSGVSLGQQLLGNLRCDGNILSLGLASQSAMERATIRISPDGQYSAKLTIRAADADAAAKLNAAGLRETAAGHLLEIAGRF